MCVCVCVCVCVFQIPKQTRFFISIHFYHMILHVNNSSYWIKLNYTINSIILLSYITYIYKASVRHIFHILQQIFNIIPFQPAPS